MEKFYTITNAKNGAIVESPNQLLRAFRCLGDELMQVSDGYHTMDELYDHRAALWIALCRVSLMVETDDGERHNHVWRSKFHSDGTGFEGWFVLGFNKKAGEQITYHLPLSRWVETDFAETLDRAPEFDGHTSADVLKRLKKIGE